MKTPLILSIFDFDDTMFRTQNFATSETIGKTMYEWYDRARSLSPEFHIVGIENIIERARNEETLNYMITHRVLDCKDEVIRLVNERGCKLKDIIFLERVGRKSDEVRRLLNENPQIEELIIYEDSISELIKYVSHLEDLRNSGLHITLVFVDKTKVFSMPWEAIELMRQNSYEERIRLS